jgi:hypothetical protein
MTDPVEIIARVRCEHWYICECGAFTDVDIDDGWGDYVDEVTREVKALEAAGYRIVGPEPTEEMVRAGAAIPMIQHMKAAMEKSAALEHPDLANAEGIIPAPIHDLAAVLFAGRAMLAAAPTYGEQDA